jgi:hypothetical protein
MSVSRASCPRFEGGTPSTQAWPPTKLTWTAYYRCRRTPRAIVPLHPSVPSVANRIWIPAADRVEGGPFAGMTRSGSAFIGASQRFLGRDPWLVPRAPKICPYGHTTNSSLRRLWGMTGQLPSSDNRGAIAVLAYMPDEPLFFLSQRREHGVRVRRREAAADR